MRLLLNWLISASAVFITSTILSGVHIDSFFTALVVALVLGIINITAKPILFILTLPITILTLGLFAFMLNVVMILMTDYLISGFVIDGFWWAVLFAVVLSIINTIINTFLKISK